MIKKYFNKLTSLNSQHDLIIKLIGAFMLVGGLVRIEMIQQHSLERQDELVSRIEACNQRVIECADFDEKLNMAYSKMQDLELQVNAYELSMLMYMSGKIDTVQVIEALEDLSDPSPTYTDSILYGIE